MEGSGHNLVQPSRRSGARRDARDRSAGDFRQACYSRSRSHLLQRQTFRRNSQTCFEGPFGELLRATGPMARGNPFRFSTKYQDDETDLLYYGYRYYSPSTGRWLCRDHIGERGGHNLYQFAHNNPPIFIDPTGLMGCAPRCLCCCAETLTWQKIASFVWLNDDSGPRSIEVGDVFSAYATLRYVHGKSSQDCKLEWWERSSTIGDRPGKHGWQNRHREGGGNQVFDEWNFHRPCPTGPGSVGPITIGPDRPSIELHTGESRSRRLYFYIRVKSAPGCPCDKLSTELRLVQTISGIANDFTTSFTEATLADSDWPD
jgi:RHS repeat-associated protein